MILLAGGRGERFGGAKLAALLAGKPVARHAADCLRAMPFAAYIAVIGPETPPLPGFTTILLDPPGAPQSRSMALGIAAAQACGATAALVALADMPLVPRRHFEAMLAQFDGDRLTSHSSGTPTGTAMPPAMFGAQHFTALTALSGDRGAGALLRDAPMLTLPDHAAIDIDHLSDMVIAERVLTQMHRAQT